MFAATNERHRAGRHDGDCPWPRKVEETVASIEAKGLFVDVVGHGVPEVESYHVGRASKATAVSRPWTVQFSNGAGDAGLVRLDHVAREFDLRDPVDVRELPRADERTAVRADRATRDLLGWKG